MGSPKNLKKSIRALFLGVSEGVLKMEPRPGLQKVRFCNYLLHLSKVQRLQKGPCFGPILGTSFVKKAKKGGSRKVLKITPKKHSKWVNKGGVTMLGSFFTSQPCSDPLCCWNAPGARFFTILASLFLHFCVAARYKEQPFKKTNKGGSRKELKIISKRTPKMRPILGGSS